MNLSQMKTLLPLVEKAAEGRLPSFGPVQIHEGDLVLNNLTPFTFPEHHGRATQTVVLDRNGNLVHSYRTL